MIHYADENGKYIGSFDELSEKPAGVVVPLPPDGRAIWNGTSWDTSSIVTLERDKLKISFAQLLIGLVSEGWITEAEGEGWLVGILPAQVLQLITTLPEEQRFVAKARATRPSEVYRSDPLVVMLGVAQGKTEEDLDDFFHLYSNV